MFDAPPRLPYNTPVLQQLPTGVVKHIFPPHIEAQRAAAMARDPFLVGFEEFLRKKLRQSDVCMDDQGIYMFNINQVAYVVEDSITEAQQRTTRKRINEFSSSFNIQLRKCSRSGKGENHGSLLHLLQIFYTEDRQTDSKTWVSF